MSNGTKTGFVLHSRFYYSRLSEDNQSLYRTIYSAWATGGNKAEIILPGNGFDAFHGLSLHNLVEYIILDNPHLFHLETSQFNYSRSGIKVSISADPVYSQTEYREVYVRLERAVSRVLSATALRGNFIDRITYLHDYLAENITYDRGLPSARSQREIHTIVGALLNNACVCDGYARALRLLCDMSRISCIVITGIGKTPEGSERHAWNIVKSQGKKFHVDTTWDSSFSEHDSVSDIFFLRNDEMFDRDHVWDRKFYPKCEADYPRKEPIVKCRSDLDNLVEKTIAERKPGILFHGSEINWSQEQFGDALDESVDMALRGMPLCVTYSYFKQNAQPYYQVFFSYGGIEP